MKFSEQITQFWLPIIFIMMLITAIVWWLFCMLSKPRFQKNEKVYVGRILLDEEENGEYCHKIVGFRKYALKKYNTAGAILMPNMNPLETEIQSIRFAATKNGLECNERYFISSVFSKEQHTHWSGKNILKYMEEKGGILKIEEMQNHQENSLPNRFLINNDRVCYVFPKEKFMDTAGVMHIKTATILFYENA
ncbi:MAG: hypothetical protein E7603_08590 [Ruminococcaceae bacterium]|nr:hypothetical protein [Oscillospiraceae bacterium]